MFKGFSIDLTTLEADDQKVIEHEAKMQEWEKEEAQKRYEESGVPEKFYHESFDTFEATNEQTVRVFNTMTEFAEAPKNRVMILCGKNGNGKSHLGCSVIRESGGEYITSSMLCLKYDSATGYNADMTREQILLHYSKVKMLVIDECCKYFLKEDLEKFLLMQIICMRYENNKPTVLITNASKEAFIKFLGTAVFDRLTETCTTIEFDWESKRKERRG